MSSCYYYYIIIVMPMMPIPTLYFCASASDWTTNITNSRCKSHVHPELFSFYSFFFVRFGDEPKIKQNVDYMTRIKASEFQHLASHTVEIVEEHSFVWALVCIMAFEFGFTFFLLFVCVQLQYFLFSPYKNSLCVCVGVSYMRHLVHMNGINN